MTTIAKAWEAFLQAIEEARELHASGAGSLAVADLVRPKCGPGKRQYNILVQYMRVVRERGSVELEEGFGQVLSDFIASAIDDVIPDAEFYEERIHI